MSDGAQHEELGSTRRRKRSSGAEHPAGYIPEPRLPFCWCDSRHGDASFLVDVVPVCGDCAEDVARAYPLPAGWQPKSEETP